MEDLVGRTIGRYKVIKEIGRGGMAIVYLAVQPELNRRVAMKVLPSQLTFDDTLVKRFQQEAVAAAGLKHPNIVTIHDVGEQDGIKYIVMEYVEGRPLSDLIKQSGSLPLTRVQNIVEQLASALDYAHRRGFVHRDIKPSNIIVSPADHVTLTDFGIVKAAEGTSLTKSGGTIGTPQYMSPEQAKGMPVDYRTDIYSLGIVLYEMLAGRVPFTADNTPAILHKQVYETPPPIRSLKPGLPPTLEMVVARALAKEPGKRFRSAGAMARVLVGAIRAAREPSTVREGVAREPPTVVAPSVRKGLPIWVLAGGGAGIILLIVIIAFSARGRGAANPSGVAMLPTATFTATSTPSPERTPITPQVSTPTTKAPTVSPAPRTPTATVLPSATPTPRPSAPTATAAPSTPAPTVVRPTPSGPGGWIAFHSDRDGNDEIYKMRADGSGVSRLTNQQADDWGCSWSPDGQWIAFTSNRDGNYEVYKMMADGSQVTRLTYNEAYDRIPDWSPDGQWIAFASNRDGNYEVYKMRADGSQVTRLTNHTADDWVSSWSPDGQWVGFHSLREGNSEIYIMRADGSQVTRLTYDEAGDCAPCWGP